MSSTGLDNMPKTLPKDKSEIIDLRILKVVSLGRLAKMVLDENENGVNRLNAKSLLYSRLGEYNGARWVGAELYERADVIRVLRAYPE